MNILSAFRKIVQEPASASILVSRFLFFFLYAIAGKALKVLDKSA